MRFPDGAGGCPEAALVASSPPLRSPCPPASLPFPPWGPARGHTRGQLSPAAGSAGRGPREGALCPRDGPHAPPGSGVTPGDGLGGFPVERQRTVRGRGAARTRPRDSRDRPPHLRTPGWLPGGCSPVTAPATVHEHFVPSAATSVGPILSLLLGVPGRAVASDNGSHSLIVVPTTSRTFLYKPCPSLCWPQGPLGLAFHSLDPHGSSPELAGAFPGIPFRGWLALSQHSCANICTPCHHHSSGLAATQLGSALDLLPALDTLGCPR